MSARLTKYPDGWARPGFTLGETPDPTPSSHYPLFGVTANSGNPSTAGFSSYQQAVEHYDTAFGGSVIYRTFSSGGIGTWTAGQVQTVTAATNATVHHSFKTWNESEITAWMNNKPNNGLPALLTFHHEPENDGWNASQIATWQQRCSRLIELRNATGRTDIKCGPILMGPWTMNPSSGRNYWRDWYVGPPISGKTPAGYPTGYLKQDFIGWDPYNEGRHDTPPVYDNPKADMLDHPSYSIMDVHRAADVPIVIGEFGSNRFSWDTSAAGLSNWCGDFMQAFVDYFDQEGIECLACMYWSDYGTVKYSIHDEPQALAEIATYVAQSRSHYDI